MPSVRLRFLPYNNTLIPRSHLRPGESLHPLGHPPLLHRPLLPVPRGPLRPARHPRNPTTRKINRRLERYRVRDGDRAPRDAGRGQGRRASEAVGGDYAV